MGKARKTFALWLAAWLLFLALPLHAAPVKNASYEEFQDLLKTSTAKIPDLQNLWAWRSQHKEPVYLGGGALRGLMQWLEKNLRNHTVAEVKAMKVPSIDGLLIQKDADRDLYHDRVGAEWFEENMPEYSGWDVLQKDFRAASIQAGGAGIEKVRVAPDAIDDPYGAVKAFYEGKLNYVDPPESKFKKFRKPDSRLKGNFKSALVMRALRFGNEIPSAEIDDATMSTMRNAVDSEKPLFVSDNYWMQKSLTKLRKSVKSDEEAIASLSKVGLTQPLAANAYYLGEKSAEGIARNYVFLKAPAEQLSPADLARFKLKSGRIDLNIAAMEKMLPMAKTPAQFADIFSPGVVGGPTYEYKKAIDDLIVRNISAFEALSPTAEQYQLMREKVFFLSAEKELLERQVARVKNARELESAIKNLYPNAGSHYLSGYREAVLELLPGKLKSLKDITTADLQPVKSACSSIDACIVVMRKQVEVAKNANEVALAFSPGFDSPNDAYSQKIQNLKIETLASKARSLPEGATSADFQKLKSLSPTIDSSIEIMREELNRAKTADQMVAAFHPGINNPKEAFVERIRALKIERMGKLATSLPQKATAEDFAKLKAVSANTDAGIDIMRVQASRAKTVDDFIQAFDPSLPAVSNAYVGRINALKDELLPQFLGRLPSDTPVAEIGRLKSATGTMENSLAITKRQLDLAKKPEDIQIAEEIGFANPSAEYRAKHDALLQSHRSAASLATPAKRNGCIGFFASLFGR